jgi:hypothetical protein
MGGRYRWWGCIVRAGPLSSLSSDHDFVRMTAIGKLSCRSVALWRAHRTGSGFVDMHVHLTGSDGKDGPVSR